MPESCSIGLGKKFVINRWWRMVSSDLWIRPAEVEREGLWRPAGGEQVENVLDSILGLLAG
jgi:hypothetical protein